MDEPRIVICLGRVHLRLADRSRACLHYEIDPDRAQPCYLLHGERQGALQPLQTGLQDEQDHQVAVREGAEVGQEQGSACEERLHGVLEEVGCQAADQTQRQPTGTRQTIEGPEGLPRAAKQHQAKIL